MRVNILLLPVQVDVQWRPLPRFQFSLRGIMLAVIAMALCFSLAADVERLTEVHNYHAVQASVATTNRAWHKAEYERYRAALSVSETRSVIVRFALLTPLVIAVAGRVLNRLNRRSVQSKRGDVAGSSTPGTGPTAAG